MTELPDTPDLQMRVNPTLQQEAKGISCVVGTAADLGWPARDQRTDDYGIDYHIEPISENGTVLGRLIALQIKSGESWFREWSEEEGWWVFRSDRRHLGYWLNHVLPVVVVVYDPASRCAYWQVVAKHTIRLTEKGFVLPIPRDKPFTAEARDDLMAVAWRRDEMALATYEADLLKLPPGAAAPLREAQDRDRTGAALLADMLASGRQQPDLTASALLNGQPRWLTSSAAVAEFWEALGGYLDEHEVQVQAGEAFVRSADLGGPKSARRLAFAGLSFKNAGDRSRARTALDEAMAQGAGMLAEIGLAELDRAIDDANPVGLPPSVAAASDSQLDAEPTVALFVAEQFARRGNLGEAVRLASRVAQRHPGAPRAQIALGRHLGRKLALESAAPGGAEFITAERAVQSALSSMRQFDGPSEQAALALVELYVTNNRPEDAVRASAPPPIGTATERESQNIEVATYGATAALMAQNNDALGHFEGVLAEGPQRLLLEVQRGELSGDEQQVRDLLPAAFEAASTDVDRGRLMARMAFLGIWPIPAVEDMRQHGVLLEVVYQILAALAEAATSPNTGIPKLRDLASVNPFAATQLIVILEKHEGAEEASREAERQIQRWPSEDGIALLRVDLLWRTPKEEEAISLTRDVVQRPDLPTSLRFNLRRRVFNYLFNQHRWKEAIPVAEAALPDAGTDRSLHWDLVGAMRNCGRFGAALVVVRQHSLRPTTDQDIWLWGQLHMGVDWSSDEIRTAISIADANPGAQVSAALLRTVARELTFDDNQRQGLVPSLPGHRPLDTGLVDELNSAFRRHGLRAASGESAGVTQAVPPAELPTKTVILSQLDALKDRVKRHLTSTGAMASALGMPYSWVLLDRLTDVLPSSRLDKLEEETAIAREALDKPWSVDLSAIFVSMFVARDGPELTNLGKPATTLYGRQDVFMCRDGVRATVYAPPTPTAAPAAQRLYFLQSAIELDSRLERIDACETGPLVVVPGLHPNKDQPWASSLQLAKDRNWYLYADDIALRGLATSAEVQSFGTIGLLLAALRERRISKEVVKDAFAVLRSAAVVEVPEVS